MLLSVLAFNVQPISATSVEEQLFPTPPQQLLNTGGTFEAIWWTVNITSTPRWLRHTIEDPLGNVVHQDADWDISTAGSTIYNPEDPTGANQGTDVFYAHKWDIPAGAMPGTYTSRVRYYSTDGDPPNDVNWEKESAEKFRVVQPLSIFKYNDEDNSGDYTTGEVGLAGWHFDVTGPGWTYTCSVDNFSGEPTISQFDVRDITPQFPLSGYHIYYKSGPNYFDIGTYTLAFGSETTGHIILDNPMGSPLTKGTTLRVSFTSYSGDTDAGGAIDLPNIQDNGTYTITETLQGNWINTEPAGSPVQRVIHIPADIGNNPGQISPSEPIVRFGNRLLTPGTELTLGSNPTSLPDGGGPVVFTVSEHNSGELALHGVVVTGTSNVPGWTTFTLDNVTYPAGVVFSGDGGVSGVLETGETWVWTVTLDLTASAYFAASADGITPSGEHVSPSSDPPYPLEADTLTIPVNPPPPDVPASSNLGIGLMMVAMAAAVAFVVYKRNKTVRS